MDQTTLKVLLLGSSGVGKSALLLRFTSDTFNAEHQSTIGVDYRFKQISPATKLMLWDTAGQERFRTLTSSYYRGAHGVVLVYDVTNRDSFDDIKRVWLRELEAYISLDTVCLLLISNKMDLVDGEDGEDAEQPPSRQVSVQEGRELARELEALFMECSAKTKKGVEEAFGELVKKIKSAPRQQESPKQRPLTPITESTARSSCC